MSSAADGDAPETDCGLEDASLHLLWARNQGQRQTTKLSSLGSQSQPLNQASHSKERHPFFHPWTPHQQRLSGQGCETNCLSIWD